MSPVSTHQTTSLLLAAEAVDQLRPQFLGELLLPGDAGYDDALIVFNAMFLDKRPAIIARCHGTADVVDAVSFGRDHDLPIAVRGGGHSVAGFSTCDGGLLIDLSLMCGVRVDPDARVAFVQGGATWADVDRETQFYALATPGGIVSTTGVGGLTLGGGIGWLRSKYGLSCDNVRSFELVTAASDVLNVSAQTHSDLFWALRGGGGNFGIVTAFEFALHPVGPTVPVFAAIYSVDDAPAVLRGWRDWLPSTPDEVTTAAFLQYLFPDHAGMPPELQGHRILLVAAVHCGGAAAAEEHFAPLREIGTPIADLSGEWPYRDLQRMDDETFGAKGRLRGYWKSTYLNALPDEVIDMLVQRFLDVPSAGGVINIPYMTGAVGRVAAEDSAFGSREAPFMVSADAVWLDPAEDDANIAWSRTTWDMLQPFATGQVFANFSVVEEGEGDTSVARRGIYRDNWERLVDIKTRYDPTNLFRFNQNIRPRA
jgi:FAD/FMN-containing dehydrogenase